MVGTYVKRKQSSITTTATMKMSAFSTTLTLVLDTIALPDNVDAVCEVELEAST